MTNTSAYPGTDEDPELVKLGKQLDLVAHQWIAQREVDRKTPEDTDNAWESIFDHLDPLVHLILARKARTKTGLAIQALAASIARQELWEPTNVEEEASLDVERMFIETVCHFVGITPFPLDPSTFLTTPVRPAIETDPIFAAIDAHRRAWAELDADIEQLDERQEQDPAAARRLEELHEAVSEAESQLIDVAPTTMAGLSALASYAVDHSENFALVVEIMSNFAEALPKIAA